jgi:hypothetical protein
MPGESWWKSMQSAGTRLHAYESGSFWLFATYALATRIAEVPARTALAVRSSWRETCGSASGWSPRPIHAPAGSAMICES